MADGDENDDFAASCSYCGRKFNYHKNLYIHMRRFHKDKPIPYRQKHNIRCSLCDKEQPYIRTYWDHIRSEHPEVQLSFQKKFFYTEEDFNQWRKETDVRTHARFVSTSVHTLSNGSIVQQLQCDRSGSYTPSATASRKHISKKIGKYCPAFIYRKKTVVDDLMEIEVDFQSTHVGHKCDLHSLRIRSEKHERVLRNRGKGRWPKKTENPPSSDGIKNELGVVGLEGKSETFTKDKCKWSNNIENCLSSKGVQNEHNTDLEKKSKTFIKSKDKRPKKSEKKDSSIGVQNEPNVDLDGKSISFINEISDILEHDPNAEIQHITCTCEEYTKIATCEHIKTLLKSLNDRKLASQEKNSDNESGGDVDFSFVDSDLTPAEVELSENPLTNDTDKSFENRKALLVEEFQQVINMCRNREHLEILQEFVAESRKHLFFNLNNE